MTAKLYTEMVTTIVQILQDTGKAIWGDTEIDQQIPRGLSFVSLACPRYPSYLTSAGVLLPATLLTTVANSRYIQLSAGDMWDLIECGLREDPYLEYPVDDDPISKCNFKRYGDVIELLIDTAPSSTVSARLWIGKRHLLQKEVGTADLAGAVNADTAAASVTLALKSLGTGTINEGTKLTIAGDSCVYNVYATATIADNAATVYIYPALKAAVLEDAVVTLALAPSTLELPLEAVFADFVAGMVAISKARSNISLGTDIFEWGRERIGRAEMALRGLTKPRAYTEYPRE